MHNSTSVHSFEKSKHGFQLASKVISYAVPCVLILVVLVSITLLVHECLFLFRLDEAGYGDSYILYDVLHFQKTGIIYRDLTQPPYLPAQYSPLVYILYSLPGRLIISENPFVAPRLITITAVLLCIGVVASIVRKLIPSRLAWVCGMLLPFSIRSVWDWVLQIRGDFLGISLSLLAIRFLLSDSRWAVLLAGVCAGLAMQFKITFIAAAVTGTLWLLTERRWKDATAFAALVTISSAGLYLLYSLREPRMISQMFALSPGIRNVTGNLSLMDQAVSELVILLALLGMASIEWRTLPRETLIVLFVTISFAVAALTDMQAGGNINYYFEVLFGVTPIAVLGAFRLMDLTRRSAMLSVVLAGVLVIHFLIPRSLQLYEWIGTRNERGLGNAELRQLEQALEGHRIFSTVPRLALLDPEPPMVEPYLLSYLHRLGKVELEPIVEPIRRNGYDVVITYEKPQTWRGVSHIDPTLRSAISSSYQPHCKFQGFLFHLPTNVERANSALVEGLGNIGCVPVTQPGETHW
jgi:hypothetical protein